ncbi:hypothetical protein [Siphonobacter aquaeclarae]|uniref:Uncharacterized protein n=1 Tax=Siphonobacter aquaeclarae TaxID=563176 RepID=A0A1G9HM98_9BACT|nr:hypothetical protein [Siphonobacter aquaeclarae]SDL13995.1 hypothetical protein SAMN04488090_0118 [Siphonobacter aquaeclarae]
MKKIHRLSSVVLAAFILPHLLNHLTAFWSGPDAHIAFMDGFRKIYRQPVVEGILLLSVVVQIGTGLRLAFTRTGRKLSFWERVQRGSGIYLALFMLIHVSAVLTGRSSGTDTNFHFAAWGVNNDPSLLFFIPYYFLGVWTFFLHIGAIRYRKVLEINRVSSPWQGYGIWAAGWGISALILAGLRV